MKKKLLASVTAGAFALSIYTGSVFAAVTYDTEKGTGFVGKGDVQSALALNNAQLQSLANDLIFTHESVDTYEITVEWTTGEGTKGEKTHTVDHKRVSTVLSGVDYNARTAKQVNGFNLTGFDITSTEGSIPKVGDTFPGNSGHVVTGVELISTTSTLKVNGVSLQ